MPEANDDTLDGDLSEILKRFEGLGYVADEALATAVFLFMKLRRPLLVEGAAGVGKTELALALAAYLKTDLIRLQCYEGLDVHSSIYEWNYQRQLLAIKLQEQSERSIDEKEAHIFSETYLLARPLLKAITHPERSPVLLIDEIDRADAEFEAFLLELLSAFQITIPEVGTIKATHIPYVVLTSNGTRELGDALRRRCLYYWIDYPDEQKERRIVEKHVPDIGRHLTGQVIRFVQKLREMDLDKVPGISETLDWAAALVSMGRIELNADTVRRTLGCIVKSRSDQELLNEAGIDSLLAP